MYESNKGGCHAVRVVASEVNFSIRHYAGKLRVKNRAKLLSTLQKLSTQRLTRQLYIQYIVSARASLRILEIF